MKKFILIIVLCLMWSGSVYATSINEDYRNATDLVKEDFAKGEIALIDFINKYPNEQLTGNAYFWLSEIYRYNKNFEDAAEGYLIVLNQFSNHERAPNSLLGLSKSLINLGEINLGCKLISNIKIAYPKADKKIISNTEYYKKENCNADNLTSEASIKKCKEFGYKENTDKFADCVLELVKINSNGQNESFNEISEEIKRSNNIEIGKALLEISKIFGERPPKETIKSPQQPNCKLNPINLRIICY